MRWICGLSSLFFVASLGVAQPIPQATSMGSVATTPGDEAFFAAPRSEGLSESLADRGFLTGDKAFPNFIGFISNPTYSVDPRSLTEFYPIFLGSWVSPFKPLPDGNFQVYGGGLTVALSERLAIGLNQGGLAAAQFDHSRVGLLNLGGFVQYEVIRDVEDQFLVTGGIHWEAPTGESSVFQGRGPAYLAPYFTVGKECGEYHFLGTFGYNFAAGSGTATTDSFFVNLHFDRRVFGWLYPLVEFNSNFNTTSFDPSLGTRLGFFNLGNFESSGSIVTVAPGFNAVIVHDRFEVGAVYQTPIYSERNLHFNEVLARVTLRF